MRTEHTGVLQIGLMGEPNLGTQLCWASPSPICFSPVPRAQRCQLARSLAFLAPQEALGW